MIRSDDHEGASVSTSGPASPPSREQLQSSLRALHEELGRTVRLDAPARGLLQQLLADVQRLLRAMPADTAGADARGAARAAADSGGGAAAARPSHQLESLAVEFEAEHPLLAGSLRQFVELCSRAGL
jgi:hypothetical protein